MKLISRVASSSVLLLIILSASLSINVPKALAFQGAIQTPSLSSPQPVIGLKFNPDFAPYLEFSIDTNGNISFGVAKEWKMPTPLGVVTLSGQLTDALLPQLTSLAQQTPMSGSDLLLIVRHKQGDTLQDSNYLIQAKQTIQEVDIKGVIDEVSVKWAQTHYMVYVDASSGQITKVSIQGDPTVTTTQTKIGCPDPTMLAWSMNLSKSNIQRDSSSPCKFQLTNLGANGADGQCPVGLGSFNVQLSFPWWHFWDGNETHVCDGKTATTIDDMAVADSATIAFNFSTKATDSTTTSSSTIQTCQVILPSGLNVRAEPTSQSDLIASYDNGTILNFVQVVNGENVSGNSLWGLSEQGYYFWLGGTDHPNG